MPLDLLAFFYFIIAFNEANEFKLSDSKLLLPFSTHTLVQYRISSNDNNCYEWQSSATDVVTVTSESTFASCSNSAIITSVWQTDHRATATIFAKHSVTGHSVKCDVIVDKIKRIEIETTTQELYLHNTPEALTVFGYDEHGNLFSTLDGIPFEWHIHGADEKQKSRSVLRFISWTESEYTTPPKIGQLESEGLQGHIQLVSGLRTGSDIVSARIKENFYQNVLKAEVRLLVMANVQLHPSIAYLIPSTTLRYTISIIQANSKLEIKLPSSQYFLKINDTSFASFSKEHGPEIIAGKYGQTSVTLIDRNVEEAINIDRSEDSTDQVRWSPSRPMSLVYIVEPAYIGFSLSSIDMISKSWPNCDSGLRSKSFAHDSQGQKLRQWILEADKTYSISVELYDHNSHRIYSSDNLRVEISLPDQFEIVSKTPNGTYFVIIPKQPGLISLKAQLLGTVQSDSLVPYGQSITGEQAVLIYDRVRVLPKIMVYPLISSHSFNLIAVSGSGEFTWKAVGFEPNSLTDIGSVSMRGEFVPLKYGEAFVIASDARSPRICDFGRLLVARPHHMSFASGRAELFSVQADEVDDLLIKRDSIIDYSDCNGIPSTNGIQVPHSHASNFGILTVGLIVEDASGNRFTDCSGLDIRLKSMDTSKLRVINDPLPAFNASFIADDLKYTSSSCIRFRVYGVSQGFTTLEAELHTVDSDSKVKILSASFSIGVYAQMRMLNPKSGISYMAIGSTKSFKWISGPQPWFLEPSTWSASIGKIHSEDKTLTKIPTVTSGPKHYSKVGFDPTLTLLNITCNDIGVFSVELLLGNRPSSSNIKTLILKRELKIYCDVPYTTRLFYKLPKLNLPLGVAPCPINTSSSDIMKDHIPNTQATRIEIGYFTQHGQELDAFNSLITKVQLTSDNDNSASQIVAQQEPDIISFDNVDFQAEDLRHGFFINPYQIGISTGYINTRVTTSLQDTRLNNLLPGASSIQTISEMTMVPPVQIALLDVQVQEPILRLFDHPDARANLKISHGSGFIHIAVSPSMEHPPQFNEAFAMSIRSDGTTSRSDLSIGLHLENSQGVNQQDSQYPLNLKLNAIKQGGAVIRVIDRCFPHLLIGHPSMAEVPVQVVGLGSLKLTVPDKIQIDHKVMAKVEALDTYGNPLPQAYTKLLGLTLESMPLTSSGLVNNSKKSQRGSSLEIIQLPYNSLVPSTDYWKYSSKNSVASFPVIGSQLGIVQLVVQTKRHSIIRSDSSPLQWEFIRSNPARIHVFAPLKLSPCGFNLLHSAETEIKVQGGPPQTTVEFKIVENSHLLQVVDSGSNNYVSDVPRPDSILLRASTKSGTAIVEASVSSNSASGDLVTQCALHVVGLSGIRIVTPLGSVQSQTMHETTGISETASLGEQLIYVGQRAPLWVEGISLKTDTHSSSKFISPLGLAGAGIQFSWSLQPLNTKENNLAQLHFWLESLGVRPKAIGQSSGMILEAKNPGPVSVYATATSSNGQTFSASLEIFIIPVLSFTTPIIPFNQHILVTPGSQLQITPNSAIMETSLVETEMLYSSCVNPADMSESAVNLDNSGLLKVHSNVRNKRNSDKDSESVWDNLDFSQSLCSALIHVSTRPKHQSQALVQQSFLHVIVKHARFSLVIPKISSTSQKFFEGLRSGGPYHFSVSFHDEFGAPFDAVSNELSSLALMSHRSDIAVGQLALRGGIIWSNTLSYLTDQISALDFARSGTFFSQGLVGDLFIRVLSPNSAESSVSPLALHIGLASSGIVSADKNISSIGYFSSLYLSLPRGPGLNLAILGPFKVGQWSCFPEQLTPGIWSSDNDNIWLHSSGIFVTKKAGSTFISFIPKSAPANDAALMGQIKIDPIMPSLRLLKNSELKDPINRRESIKVFIASNVEEKLNFNLISEQKSDLKKRACQLDSDDILVQNCPFRCSVTIPSSSDYENQNTNEIPNWSRILLIFSKKTSELNVKMANRVFDQPNQLFKTTIMPSHTHFGHWICSLSLNKEIWTQYDSSSLVISANENINQYVLQIEMKDSEEGSPVVVTSRNLEIIPPFTIITLQSTSENSIHIGSTEIDGSQFDWSKSYIIVHVPLAVQNLMHEQKDSLTVRSLNNDKIHVLTQPRHINAEDFRIIIEKARAHPDQRRQDSLDQIIEQFNDYKITNEQEKEFWLKQFLVCEIQLISNYVTNLEDKTVDLVFSLATTGQHSIIEVVINAKISSHTTPVSLNQIQESSSFIWLRAIPVIVIIAITAIIMRSFFLTPSLVSNSKFNGTNLFGGINPDSISRTMPHPRISMNTSDYQEGAPKLWSRSSPIGGNSFRYSTPLNSENYIRSRNTGSPIISGDGHRRSGGYSPSRLRSAFDKSM